jgi:hypothetical protein
VINSLANKNTWDDYGLSNNFVHKILPSILTPLHHVIKLSFANGAVPPVLKIAKVVPIFKSGEKNQSR